MSINRTFVRFGKLGLTKQKGFGSDTFHSPPCERGLYAMPKRFQELFLIGSIKDTQNIKNLPEYDKYKDEDGNVDEKSEFWIKRKKAWQKLRHEFYITPKDTLWHHLDVPNNEVISRHNCWVKTSFKTWEKALAKESISLRARSLALFNPKKDGSVNKVIGGVNSTYKRSGCYSKDHFEVFFDTKVF
jgi:hypothetical protein